MEHKQSRWIEKGPGFGAGLGDLGKHLGIKTASAGVVAAIFGCSGPALLVIGAAICGGFPSGDVASVGPAFCALCCNGATTTLTSTTIVLL